ncbi:MAG: biopolymer transporter ExbD [Cyanobacteria bacterium J06588_5]
MRLPEDNDSTRTSVNILPMIDVIFAILAFFILSTLYLTRSEGLPVNLPQSVTSTPIDQVDITLTITPDGSLFLDSRAVDVDALADEVRAIANSNPIKVTIRADENTSHGRVVTAMDQLRKVEQIQMGIATTQP